MIRGTGLYELWKTGRYKSYPPSMLVDLVAKILALVPPWTRVYRVQRDIPMPLVRLGISFINLYFYILNPYRFSRAVRVLNMVTYANYLWPG